MIFIGKHFLFIKVPFKKKNPQHLDSSYMQISLLSASHYIDAFAYICLYIVESAIYMWICGMCVCSVPLRKFICNFMKTYIYI